MKKMLLGLAALAAMMVGAQETTTTTTTITGPTTVKTTKTTVITTTEQRQQETVTGQPTLAIFVRNRTRNPFMNDEVDGIRDRLSAAIGLTDAVQVLDPEDVMGEFGKGKQDVDAMVFGASVVNVSRMLHCDFIAAISITQARAMPRPTGVTHFLSMTMKLTDRNGHSVPCMAPWSSQWPGPADAGENMIVYDKLVEKFVAAAGTAIANSVHNWRAPMPPPAPAPAPAVQGAPAPAPAIAVPAGEVSFTVSTTIDNVIPELESQTKGLNGEQLQELRKVVGGATVMLDGVTIGSAPDVFTAEPGVHQLVVERQWMIPYNRRVMIKQGSNFNIALEMTPAAAAQWGSVEALRADVAHRYAQACKERGIKINVDTTNWRDVSVGANPPPPPAVVPVPVPAPAPAPAPAVINVIH